MFFKKDVFIGIFGFVGYILSMVAVFNIMDFLGVCLRKKLWVIIILSSLPSVLVQASTTETDIIVAGLVCSSVFLFLNSLKTKEKPPIFIASLAFALAIGTKTTAIMMIPAVGLIFMYLCFRLNKNLKSFFWFLFYGLINFIIFSSYNYILNYFSYGNFMGVESFIAINKNYYGLKGAFSNIVKHFFMMIDFTGFKWGLYLHDAMRKLEFIILNFFHIPRLPDSFYTVSSYKSKIVLTDPVMGAGILGFLVFLPSAFIALLKFKLSSLKRTILALLGLSFLINIFVISYIVNYSDFNVRYVVAFIALASPVMVYSYGIKFKPYKYLVIAFSLFSLLLISSHIAPRPFILVLRALGTKNFREVLSNRFECVNEPYCYINEFIKHSIKPGAKVLVFPNIADNIYILKKLDLEGYQIYFETLENAKNIDFSKYNVIILDNNQQNFYATKTVYKDIDKVRGVRCRYVRTSLKISIPVYGACVVENTFLKENKLDKILDIKYNYSKTDKGAYNFYQNKENPPKFIEIDSRK